MQVFFVIIVVLILVGVAESSLRILLLGESILHLLIVNSGFRQLATDGLFAVAKHCQQQVFRIGPLSLHGTRLQQHQLDDAAGSIAQQRVLLQCTFHDGTFQALTHRQEVNSQVAQYGGCSAGFLAHHGQQQMLRLDDGAMQTNGFFFAEIQNLSYLW